MLSSIYRLPNSLSALSTLTNSCSKLWNGKILTHSTTSSAIHKRAFSSHDDPRVHFPLAVKKVSVVQGVYPTQVLANEPNLVGANVHSALKSGGVIIRNILSEMLKIPYVQAVQKGEVPGYQIYIHSRKSLLNQGEASLEPFWHLDWAGDYMPHFFDLSSFIRNYIACCSNQQSGVSGTEFVAEPIDVSFPDPWASWRTVHYQIERIRHLKKIKALDGEIFETTPMTFHRATPAHQAGRRIVINLSILPEEKIRQLKQMN